MSNPVFSLALLLYAQGNTPEPEADVGYAISELHEDWTDERKADFYALLVEGMDHIDTRFQFSFNAVLQIVKKAYASNEHWAARHG